MRKIVLLLTLVLAVPLFAADPVATFSILGFDPKTGEVGGAVQSRVFSVGNGVLWAEAGVGVVATQAVIDVAYGQRGLELLRAGLKPEAAVKAIWESDPDPRPKDWTKQGRQFAIMDDEGNYAAFTGPKASAWAGNRSGKFVTAQGNILAGEAVVADMVSAFEKTEGHLSYRLMAALDAGQKAGGDTRGTIGYVIAQFEKSSEFRALYANSRRDYKYCAKVAKGYVTKSGATLDTLVVDRLSLPLMQKLNEAIASGREESRAA